MDIRRIAVDHLARKMQQEEGVDAERAQTLVERYIETGPDWCRTLTRGYGGDVDEINWQDVFRMFNEDGDGSIQEVMIYIDPNDNVIEFNGPLYIENQDGKRFPHCESVRGNRVWIMNMTAR